MIVIVDYGAGNLNSVKKAFDHLGADAIVTREHEKVSAADALVLPGVGHFSALSALDRSDLRVALRNGIDRGKPFLGICLGMQWLFEGSAEAPQNYGEKLFPGICERFPLDVKSPHVGWNSLKVRDGSRLLKDVAADSYVYFTHSFRAPVVDTTVAVAEYGQPFSAAVERDNIFGVQFHPEKSGEAGLTILRNFCEVPRC